MTYSILTRSLLKTDVYCAYLTVLVTFAKGQKQTPFLLLKHFKYIKHRSSQNSTYWKCWMYDTGRCKARCTTYVNNSIKISGDHSHMFKPICDLNVICQELYNVVN
ncbi:unnamed protein product [Psylliodes chrysocephalus]|uniref:FLYWCH-type domain-containing protein n=1 Tax=Psylliodes chrysocephalus TaxID=3402493 RepID=A0A9P0CMH1_9CUCU|nr:unnamed protein product [Psylliodes chrysocephala]